MSVVRALAAAVLLLTLASADAHGPAPVAGDAPWTFDPWVAIPLALSAGAYALGALRVHLRVGRWGAVRSRRLALFALGWLALAGALVSPLHWLGEHLFAFHMIEHELVMAVAAPLLVLARPTGTLLWALPRSARRSIASAFAAPAAASLWRGLTRPRNATLLHGLAIWLWHVPALFDATISHLLLHRLQHVSFLLSALLFWWAMLRRSGTGAAVWHLFVTMVHTSVLGALIALSPRVLYRLQTADAPAFGLSPLEDQQLAGVIMWIPAETVYAAAALILAAMWIRGSRAADVARPRVLAEEAPR